MEPWAWHSPTLDQHLEWLQLIFMAWIWIPAWTNTVYHCHVSGRHLGMCAHTEPDLLADVVAWPEGSWVADILFLSSLKKNLSGRAAVDLWSYRTDDRVLDVSVYLSPNPSVCVCLSIYIYMYVCVHVWLPPCLCVTSHSQFQHLISTKCKWTGTRPEGQSTDWRQNIHGTVPRSSVLCPLCVWECMCWLRCTHLVVLKYLSLNVFVFILGTRALMGVC